ncbi:uncharacterized protein LOC134215283 [Armigeres subalbatus]|uniref:uncharacterized protein LOC134215283 n=1 Tax=Armigeres subalbatus TaxID=124917 RepID=UPI002ED16C21
MIKAVVVFAVLCGLTSGYSVPAQNGYRTVQRTLYGVRFQNQQLRNQRVSNIAAAPYSGGCQNRDIGSAELPNVDPEADAFHSEQYPAKDHFQPDGPALHDVLAEQPIADESLSIPAAPAAVPSAIPKKRKTKVPAVQVDSEEEEEQDAQVGLRGVGDSDEPNVYFPVGFGSASGGAIAIANSYSTGKGGSATSTATAYGSPSNAGQSRNARVQLGNRYAALRGRY